MYKAVIFDIGHTLVQYHNTSLNWTAHYKPALREAAEKCSYSVSEKQLETAAGILKKYNTRVNPREYEVSSETIFKEIFERWNKPTADMAETKKYFFMYFRRGAVPFAEAKQTLQELKQLRIQTGILSDVPYGMDNIYALEDIAAIKEYLDIPLTSNDVGYRKPNIRGLQLLAEKMDLALTEMIYVGDEEKDIICANRAGACSVLINRTKESRDYGQKMEISTLLELVEIVRQSNEP